MNKFLKISLISLASIIVFFYLAFLIAPPIINATYDLSKYKNDLQKLVKDSAKLNLDYSDIKIYSTPLFSLGVIINDVNITLDDNSTVFTSPKVKAGIALPSLITLTIKTSKCEVVNPFLNLEIVDDEQYKLVQVIENIINENNAKPKPEPTEEQELINKITEKIRIKIPSVKFLNYNVLVNDLESKHNLKLTGEELLIGYNSADNSIKLKTNAKLLSDGKENINAKINLKSALLKQQKVEEQVDPDEKISIVFVNPVTIYQTYDLKANIDSRLRIKETKKGIVSYGYLNIDDMNLRLSDIRLPNSYIHAKTRGRNVVLDTNLNTKDDEKIAILAKLKYGKNPKIKTEILTNHIHFANLLDLLTGLLDSLNIKNNLKQINATGYLVADTTINTNFKKLKSTGSILIKDGSFVNTKTNIGIKNIIVNIILDNNILNIKDTSLLINGSQLDIKGSIDTKSNTDIKININDLSLPELFNAFAPIELKNTIRLNSAHLTANISAKGKLKKLYTQLNAKLNNLELSDPKKTMFVKNDILKIDYDLTPKTINCLITNRGFNINLPQMKTVGKINDLKINVDNELITINPFDFIYNDLSKISINGDISDYSKNPVINIIADGKIATKDINKTLGREVAHFIQSKGVLPLKVSIQGDSKEQNLKAQIFADNNNFLTPINLKSLVGGESLVNINVKLKGNKIKTHDTGLFKAENGFANDLDLNMLNAKKIIDLTTILENGHINLFRIHIPQTQYGQIALFKNSSFDTKGKIILNGDFDDLSFGGDFKINNLNIPEILFKTNLIDLNFVSHGVNTNLKDIDINGSVINAGLKAVLRPADTFKISDIHVNSSLINVDKALVTVDRLMKYMPPTSPAKPSSNPAQANIPVTADGKFNIKKLTTGAMVIKNIKGNLGVKNNDFIITNLDCDAFKGDVKGDIKMNLLSSLLTIKLNGKGLDSNQALTEAANMKDMISGDLDFKTNIRLKGSTYNEQVKSLKGDVDFELRDGQYGPFAKLENFFLAENIRENAIFKNTIGLILTPIMTIDSTHYEKLSGNVSFKDGIVSLNSIKSQGDILCILVKGDMNLLTNNLESQVRVRLASAVSDLLGPIAVANPVNLIKKTPGLNVGTAKLFSVFSQVVTEDEYKEIPDFSSSHNDANATKFQIVLKGDVARPLSLVKSFKWLALQADMDKAYEFSENYIKEQEELARQELIKQLQSEYEEEHKLKVGVQKILQMDTTAPAVKELLQEEAEKTTPSEEL